MIQVHLLNSRGTLDAYREQILGLTEAALERVQALLPIDGADVVIYDEPRFVIPATGIGGYCDAPHTVFVPLDPKHPKLADTLETELVPSLAHELHHAMRHRGPGYGDTLLEALVSEGLATHFETAFRGDGPPYTARALTPEQLMTLTAQAEREFGSATYDHQRWFFGAGGELPFYAGYSIGYNLVGRGLARLGESAATAHAFPASSFLEAT